MFVSLAGEKIDSSKSSTFVVTPPFTWTLVIHKSTIRVRAFRGVKSRVQISRAMPACLSRRLIATAKGRLSRAFACESRRKRDVCLYAALAWSRVNIHGDVHDASVTVIREVSTPGIALLRGRSPPFLGRSARRAFPGPKRIVLSGPRDRSEEGSVA